jgi:hypothetical protein
MWNLSRAEVFSRESFILFVYHDKLRIQSVKITRFTLT